MSDYYDDDYETFQTAGGSLVVRKKPQITSQKISPKTIQAILKAKAPTSGTTIGQVGMGASKGSGTGKAFTEVAPGGFFSKTGATGPGGGATGATGATGPGGGATGASDMGPTGPQGDLGGMGGYGDLGGMGGYGDLGGMGGYGPQGGMGGYGPQGGMGGYGPQGGMGGYGPQGGYDPYGGGMSSYGAPSAYGAPAGVPVAGMPQADPYGNATAQQVPQILVAPVAQPQGAESQGIEQAETYVVEQPQEQPQEQPVGEKTAGGYGYGALGGGGGCSTLDNLGTRTAGGPGTGNMMAKVSEFWGGYDQGYSIGRTFASRFGATRSYRPAGYDNALKSQAFNLSSQVKALGHNDNYVNGIVAGFWDGSENRTHRAQKTAGGYQDGIVVDYPEGVEQGEFDLMSVGGEDSSDALGLDIVLDSFEDTLDLSVEPEFLITPDMPADYGTGVLDIIGSGTTGGVTMASLGEGFIGEFNLGSVY